MTAQHRDFDAEANTNPSPGKFTLGGREWHLRNRDDLSFGYVEIIAAGDVKPRDFFSATLAPAEVADFLAMLDRPNDTLTLGKVVEVMQYVAEVVLNRPTTPAASSSPGTSNTRRKSAAGSSSQGTPRRKSA